ncbi:Y-family DNA polymerase [Flectobacillus sp. DC10W]|uniref:Y-family DNA polymerase n=1 Tax=Flectobacillus longus TaxID=2984207 RepID=A0ABT6YKL3_9BACT|nr:Y-family DNA polymerase [Flectobacillus longus]MDI9863979.1 Y-family DNA polymerase [Flectobacillus longus]
MVALVDCNNFYASCERLFQPRLLYKPIVVLSNNDGCVVARSDEAKSLGIKMGIPAFQIKDLIDRDRVISFSSNYTLYGDISNRVMQTLSNFSPEVEIYSIDEAFLNFSGIQNLEEYAKSIKTTVKQWIGVPVCVGVAETKTLAKIANRYAKKNFKNLGVWVIDSEQRRIEALKSTDIEDVWGIGNKYSKMLRSFNINTAYDFSQASENWVKTKMSVVGQRTLLELNGVSCLTLELISEPKNNICNSRSFGQPIISFSPLSEAISNHAASCAFKLRKQKSIASFVQVFIMTNRFSKEDGQYINSTTVSLPIGSNDSKTLIKYALVALKKIYKDGFKYKKAGVQVFGIVPENHIQLGLFDSPSNAKSKKVMKLMDDINFSNGKNTLKLAAQGFDRSWRMKNEKLSPCYTTRFKDLLIIDI